MSNDHTNNSNRKNDVSDSNNDKEDAYGTELTNKIEEIMQLMDQRAHGYVSTEQVEAAVSSVLGSLGAIPPKGPPPAKARTRRKASESWTQPATTTISTSTSIQVDQGNYDDDDDEDEAEINKNSTQNDSDKHHPESTQQSPLSSFSAAAAALDTPFMTTIGSNNDPTQIMSLKEYQELLKEIPMGKVGAQMMTAFGDGSRPNIEALKLALEGTRRALQYIVMDARALRRRIKLQYSQAQLETLAGKKSIAGTSTSTTNNVTADNPATTISATTSLAHTMATTTDPSLAYRAILIDEAAMHDPLGRHPPCGFDVEQLARLYPEELQAYDRWNELHEEYEHPNPVEVDGDTDKSKTTTRTTSPTTTTNNQEEEEENDYLGGHLKERVAVFNIRTDHMPQDMYLHFSRIRQGSFLPRGRGRQQTQLEREWDSLEVRKGRGRGGTWLHMPAITVRFLHWLGFQPPEVPPPDTETTQVLAFLGHDRMGRIVEKAIQLRNFRLGKDALEFRELPPWEQLTVEEIQAALDDPDVKPAPLFPFDDNPNHGICLPNVQLYFGPGFEQRLELELEEFLAASSSQREPEDAEVRRQEREFYQKLSKPVEQLDGLAFLVESHKKNKQLEEEDAQGNEMEPMDGINDTTTNQDDDDNEDELEMTPDDTPPKRKSRTPKSKQREEGSDHPDPETARTPAATQGKSKRLRSK